MTEDLRRSWRDSWMLDPEVAFCNHGSFGACPRAVLDAQLDLRREIEADPVRFFTHRYERMLDEARHRLASFLAVDAAGLVFVPNATTGVNTVLASWPLGSGDEVLVTDHGYEACILAAERHAAARGAAVVTARIPVPVQSPGDVVEAISAATTPRTRLAIIDHVTSPTGLVFPIQDIVAELGRRGIDTLVDGAHGPGQVELHLDALGAAAYTGNCHKWLCAPKGSGFLWVCGDLRDDIRALVTSHGEAHRRAGRSHLHDRFDWVGTADPTPYLAVPAAVDHLASLLPGGWPAVLDRNRRLALEARRGLAAAGFAAVGPGEMVGSMTAALLPHRTPGQDARSTARLLSDRMYQRHLVQAPVTWRRGEDRLAVRFSSHLHTSLQDVDRLVAAVADLD